MGDRTTQPLLIGSKGDVCLPSPVPVGSPPFSESRLQDILQTHADILPINHFDPIFRPLCCIGREVPTNAGPIDLLFMSSAGYITVVETKLWKSAEARRKVVAQIIDYAKELVHWDYGTLEARFCRYADGIGESESTLYEYVCQQTGEHPDEVDFQDTVNRCLSHGRFLLMILGDGIRENVRELASYLQKTPSLQFTLGLVEVACYQGSFQGDEDVLLLVPNVVAKTVEITRAVVRVEMSDEAAGNVTTTVTTPYVDSRPAASSLSKNEFYEQLAMSVDESTAKKTRDLIDGLLDNSDLLNEHFTKHMLRVRVTLPDAETNPIPILNISRRGAVQAEPKIRQHLVDWEYPDDVGKKYLDAVKMIHPQAVPQQTPNGKYIRKKGVGDKTPLREMISKFAQFQSAILGLVEDIQLNAAD